MVTVRSRGGDGGGRASIEHGGGSQNDGGQDYGESLLWAIYFVNAECVVYHLQVLCVRVSRRSRDSSDNGDAAVGCLLVQQRGR